MQSDNALQSAFVKFVVLKRFVSDLRVQRREFYEAYTNWQLVRWEVVGSTSAIHRDASIVIIRDFPKKINKKLLYFQNSISCVIIKASTANLPCQCQDRVAPLLRCPVRYADDNFRTKISYHFSQKKSILFFTFTANRFVFLLFIK